MCDLKNSRIINVITEIFSSEGVKFRAWTIFNNIANRDEKKEQSGHVHM